MFDPRTRSRPRPRLKTPESESQPNFLLIKLLLILIAWLPLVGLIYFIDPNSIKDIPLHNSYFVFFILLFLALFVTIKLAFGHTRRSLLIPLATILYLYLRLLQIGNFLNLVLILLLLIALEAYLSAPATDPPPPDENL